MSIAHSSLTGSNIHEPKGIASATSGQVYIANGAGSGTWTGLSTTQNPFANALYHVTHTLPSGTGASTLTKTTWNTRSLQAENVDQIGVTLASNDMLFPAGTYWVQGSMNIYMAIVTGSATIDSSIKTRIYNLTDASTIVVGEGITSTIPNAALGFVHTYNIPIFGKFTLAVPKHLLYQVYVVSSDASTTFKEGNPTGAGENEVYADLMFWKTA